MEPAPPHLCQAAIGCKPVGLNELPSEGIPKQINSRALEQAAMDLHPLGAQPGASLSPDTQHEETAGEGVPERTGVGR